MNNVMKNREEEVVVFISGNATSGDRMVPVLLRTVLSPRLFLVFLINKLFSSGVFCILLGPNTTHYPNGFHISSKI